MRRHRNGAHAGSAPAVRDTERLVQIQMAYVGADFAGRRQADLSVHVRSIHVNLSAVLVDDGTDVFDPGLEHAMG